MSNKMTKRQIENYRKVLINMYGLFANLLSDEEIEEHKNKLQEKINTAYPSQIFKKQTNTGD